MSSTLRSALAALATAACARDPARPPVRTPVDYAVVPPSAAQMDAAAARLPRCVLPELRTDGWPTHVLSDGRLALRLPPGYTPEPSAAPPGAALQRWTGADSGAVSVLLDTPLGGTFVLQPEGRVAGQPTRCAVSVLGHTAEVTMLSYAVGASGDTLHVATLDAPVDDGTQIGAGVLHPRRGGRDTLLAGLAALARTP